MSVHDASPKFQKELEIIFDKLKEIKIKNKSIAIVPNWGYKWDIRKYPRFIWLMKKQEKEGWELLLHGYTHSHPKYVPWYNIFFGIKEGWEFYALNYDETKQLILKGLKIFEEVFGFKPIGFIPPNWRLSKKGYKAIKDLGFDYTTSLRHIKWFDKRWEKIPVFFKCISEYSLPNKVLNLFNNRTIKQTKIRLVIHPHDKI